MADRSTESAIAASSSAPTVGPSHAPEWQKDRVTHRQGLDDGNPLPPSPETLDCPGASSMAAKTFRPLTSGARAMVTPSVARSGCAGAMLTTSVERDPAVTGGTSSLLATVDVSAIKTGAESEADEDAP